MHHRADRANLPNFTCTVKTCGETLTEFQLESTEQKTESESVRKAADPSTMPRGLFLRTNEWPVPQSISSTVYQQVLDNNDNRADGEKNLRFIS